MPSGDLRSLALGLGLFRMGRGTYVPPPEHVPTLSIGTQTLAGLEHEAAEGNAAWPSPQPARVRTLFPLVSATFDPGVAQSPVVSRATGKGPHALDVTALAPSVTLAARWRYQGFEALLACALGYMAPDYPQVLGAGAYRHLYEVAPDLAREPWEAVSPTTALHRRLTCAIWRQVSVWEMWSSMVSSLTLSSDEVLTGEVTLQGYALSRQSTVNTVMTMHQLAPGPWPLVSVRHAELWLGPASEAVPLSAADAVCYRSLSLQVTNPLRSGSGPRTGLRPEEYTRESPPALTLRLELPRYAADTWLERWDLQTLLMARWRCTGALIGASATPYQLTWYLPLLRLTAATPGPVALGLSGVTLEAVALVPETAMAGMPTGSALSPVLVEVISGESRHPLLA